MRQSIWTCDGVKTDGTLCEVTLTSSSANVPESWYELSAWGASIGHFCASCAKCVNVPDAVKRKQDRQYPLAECPPARSASPPAG